MKAVKRELKNFHYFDKLGMEAYLEEMAKKGWMIEKIGFLWKFKKIDPVNRKFSVVYYPFPAEKSEDEDPDVTMLRDFAAHDGWEPAFTGKGIQIYFNDKEGATPIETEPVMEVMNIERAYRKYFLKWQLLFIGVYLLGLLSFFSGIRRNAISLISEPGFFVGMLFLPFLSALAVTEAGSFLLWRHRAKREAERGVFLNLGKIRYLKVIFSLMGISLCIYVVFVLIYGSRFDRVNITLTVLRPFLLVFLGLLFKLRKKIEEDAFSTKAGLFLLIIALLFAFQTAGENMENRAKNIDNKVFLKRTKPLLRYGDLPGRKESKKIRHLRYYTDSLFLSEEFCSVIEDVEDMESEGPDFLTYQVYEIKVPLFYEGAKGSEVRGYRKVKEDDFSASEVYFRRQGSELHYVLCFEKRIVKLSLYDEKGLDTAGKRIIGEKLGKADGRY